MLRATKNRIINISLLTLIVLAMLGLGEIVVRFTLTNPTLFPRFHTDASYGEFVLRRMRPNSEFWHTSRDGSWKFVTNAQGFRDFEDYKYNKSSDVLRVLALGDSHTLGHEVRQERTFSEVTERYLQGEGINAQVLNTGISGFSTAEELAFLENEGFQYNPDVVVLGFFSNDFEDNIKSGLFSIENDALVLKKTQHIPGVSILKIVNNMALFRLLSQNSYLFSYAMNTAWEAAKHTILSRSEAKLQTEFAIATEQLNPYKKELARRLVERIYSFCRENGIRLVILDIPNFMSHDDGVFSSSVPSDLETAFRMNSDAFLSSEMLFDQYRSVADIHVPMGHNHISEFAHLIFGVAVAKQIQEFIVP